MISNISMVASASANSINIDLIIAGSHGQITCHDTAHISWGDVVRAMATDMWSDPLATTILAEALEDDVKLIIGRVFDEKLDEHIANDPKLAMLSRLAQSAINNENTTNQNKGT